MESGCRCGRGSHLSARSKGLKEMLGQFQGRRWVRRATGRKGRRVLRSVKHAGPVHARRSHKKRCRALRAWMVGIEKMILCGCAGERMLCLGRDRSHHRQDHPVRGLYCWKREIAKSRRFQGCQVCRQRR